MALQKLMSYPGGIVGDYLRIGDFSLNKKMARLTVMLDLYKDVTFKDEGPIKSNVERFQFILTKEEMSDDRFIALSYSKIKAENRASLDGVTDVFEVGQQAEVTPEEPPV